MRCVALLLISFLTSSLPASDWPGWRGWGGVGVSGEANVPVEWSKDKNIAWKAALPGKGASSPAIVGDRVYVTTQTADTGLHVLAIDRKQGDNFHNMATPTPAANAQGV